MGDYPAIRSVANSESQYVLDSLNLEHPQVISVIMAFCDDIERVVSTFSPSVQTILRLRQ